MENLASNSYSEYNKYYQLKHSGYNYIEVKVDLALANMSKDCSSFVYSMQTHIRTHVPWSCLATTWKINLIFNSHLVVMTYAYRPKKLNWKNVQCSNFVFKHQLFFKNNI